MRVLYVLSKYPQLSETYITAEIAFMLRAGVDVRVWTPFTRLPDVPPQATVYSGSLHDAVQKFQPNLVHIHHTDVAVRLYAQLDPFKIPITVRGHSFDFCESTILRFASFPQAARIYLFPHFSRLVKHVKVFPLPVAFDSTKFLPSATKDPMMVLRLGAGLTTKNIGDFYRVAKLCPGFKFVLGLASCDDTGRVADQLRNDYPGSNVTLFKDVSWDAAEKLTRRAGIFLHTSDDKCHPFGQPISIAESLSTGSIVLVRGCMAAREYAGDAAFYYSSVEEAAETINMTMAWTPEIRSRHRDRAILQGALYMDKVVLPKMLDDWETIAGKRR